jgi:Na+-driven multidrug efflux pump
VAEAWTRVSLVVNTAFALVDGIILCLFGNLLVSMYTSDTRVIALFNAGLPSIVMMHGFDSLSTCCQNAFRGAGRQALAARMSLGSLWGIGLPLSIALTLLAPSETLRFPMSIGGFAVGLLVADAMCARDIKLNWDWAVLAHDAHTKEGHHEKAPTDDVEAASEMTLPPSSG